MPPLRENVVKTTDNSQQTTDQPTNNEVEFKIKCCVSIA